MRVRLSIGYIPLGEIAAVELEKSVKMTWRCFAATRKLHGFSNLKV